MPGTVGEGGQPAKRKRTSSDKRPSKRAKSESSDEEGVQAQILLLENEIFESKMNYNNIAILIKILREDEHALDAALSLWRIFTKLMVAKNMTLKPETVQKEAVVVRWLKERYSEYKTGLLDLVGEEGIGSTALEICMRLLKAEGLHLRSSSEYNFPTGFLTDIVRVVLKPESDGTVRGEFSEKFVEEYDDIRFYTFEAIEKILGESQNQIPEVARFDNVLEVLKAIESIPESNDELKDFYVQDPMKKTKKTHALHSLAQHKKRAQKAWMALMQLEMDKDQRKSILRIMEDTVAPWFTKPELLMDFLTDSYDAGGSTSVLALSGVYYLIDNRGLDYPSFYRKLYSLLDSEILHSKNRSKFFRLLNTFMGSTHLPADLVASFLKRLSRLTLNAPPAAIVAVVPWIYNLLKMHPTCTFMIHREVRTAEAKELLEKEGMDDPFLMEEEDPMETHAIESSLWEIVMLQSHYHPNVASMAKIISEQFTKQAYNLEDFLDHSYGSMVDAEFVKDIKKTPVVEFEIPKKIFMKNDMESGVEDSLLVKLWDFN